MSRCILLFCILRKSSIWLTKVEEAAVFLAQRVVLQHLRDGTLDECQWCAQVVADVGEVAQFDVCHALLETCGQSQAVDVHDHEDEQRGHQQAGDGVEQPCPWRFPEGGLHDDGDTPHLVAPYTVVVRGFDQQVVGAGTEVEETE